MRRSLGSLLLPLMARNLWCWQSHFCQLSCFNSCQQGSPCSQTVCFQACQQIPWATCGQGSTWWLGRIWHESHPQDQLQHKHHWDWQPWAHGLWYCHCSKLVHTPQGKIVCIFNEYAYVGKGSSIHSPGQMEHFEVSVCDKSIKVGGKQHIETLEGHTPFVHQEWFSSPQLSWSLNWLWPWEVSSCDFHLTWWMGSIHPGSWVQNPPSTTFLMSWRVQ